MWAATKTELAGWREALMTGRIFVGLLLRLLIALALVAIGVLGASQPVLTLSIAAGVVLLVLLVRLRVTSRL